MSSRRSHLYVTGTELAVLCLAIACAAFMVGYYLGVHKGVVLAHSNSHWAPIANPDPRTL